MPFSVEMSIPAITVFFQGLLSFFSPCVLPLLPLYVSYFAGGSKEIDAEGRIFYPRAKIMLNTFFFVLGISGAFFILGFGFTALGKFFSGNRLLFAKISGIIMIMFGFYQLNVFGQSETLEKERRLPFSINSLAMGPVTALFLGFTFSFAWTPCIGPILGSVLLMAGSSGNALKAFFLIGSYTAGFVIPFLAVGLFTGTVLSFFKKHQNVVKYSVKAGAILLILMGTMTLTGYMNGITNYLSSIGTNQNNPSENKDFEEDTSPPKETQEETQNNDLAWEYDFTLTDQFGNVHTLSDYKDKTVFLNFWGTWCPPCRGEMPEIQALYEKYEKNEKDLIVLGIAAPHFAGEGSEEEIKKFLSDNNLSFPVVFDEGGKIFEKYGIYSFPTTFMFDNTGEIFGYVEGALSGEFMESIVKQTMEGKKE